MKITAEGARDGMEVVETFVLVTSQRPNSARLRGPSIKRVCKQVMHLMHDSTTNDTYTYFMHDDTYLMHDDTY